MSGRSRAKAEAVAKGEAGQGSGGGMIASDGAEGTEVQNKGSVKDGKVNGKIGGKRRGERLFEGERMLIQEWEEEESETPNIKKATK